MYAGRNRSLTRGGTSAGLLSGCARGRNHIAGPGLRGGLGGSLLRGVAAETIVGFHVEEGLLPRDAAVRHRGALHLIQAGGGSLRGLHVKEVGAARSRGGSLVQATGQATQAVRLGAGARAGSGVSGLHGHLGGLGVGIVHHGVHEGLVTGVLVEGAVIALGNAKAQPAAQARHQATARGGGSGWLLVVTVQVAAVVLLGVQVHGLSCIIRGGALAGGAVGLLAQGQAHQVPGAGHNLANRGVGHDQHPCERQQQVNQNLHRRDTPAQANDGGAEDYSRDAASGPYGLETVRKGRVPGVAGEEEGGRNQQNQGAQGHPVIAFDQVGASEDAPGQHEAEHRNQQGTLAEDAAEHRVPGVQGRAQQTERGVGAPVVPLNAGADEAEEQQYERAAITTLFGFQVGARRANRAHRATDSVSDAQPDGGDGAGDRIRRLGTATGTAPRGGGALAGGFL